ncbi:hypothetical protein M5X00_28410 [Paenibacillus alvei]|uniref:hypothetical protein n=1 Tax=Paenibacillus alvei TaxID=44250 RepID=UPI00028999DB|nr:hypothetical protein [Paenibacillus alvei]EJW19029.1 hypothetical protein PAV_2c08220 [Paenibacillus alvei DSM 29]MCY9543689.1 hypothetical protein [Paenibacillus alvei]MCY9737194.1 hypothetical protein [Paenibacillus alvei]MCY9758151.1 hypothetical protein [Paenibacillus alvei]MEC0082880.1 hypothetical protein [Paenibacillus alvei]
MTQLNKQAQNIAELNTVFMILDEVAQEYALSLLQALRFAQASYRNSSNHETQSNVAS